VIKNVFDHSISSTLWLWHQLSVADNFSLFLQIHSSTVFYSTLCSRKLIYMEYIDRPFFSLVCSCFSQWKFWRKSERRRRKKIAYVLLYYLFLRLPRADCFLQLRIRSNPFLPHSLFASPCSSSIISSFSGLKNQLQITVLSHNGFVNLAYTLVNSIVLLNTT
jgi:hypothetical protein